MRDSGGPSIFTDPRPQRGGLPTSGQQQDARANTKDGQRVLSVSALNRRARMTLEDYFSQVWVTGELSNFSRPRSGHWYFTLKDDQAQVRCAMFVNRNRHVQMQPRDGQQVNLRGRVSLYEGRGDFQVIVDHMEPAGEGALRQAFDALKIKLQVEGLFESGHKKSLPAEPKCIAVVTSASGAAIRDVLAVWQRRYPLLEVILIPTQVQGADAEPQVIDALQRADQIGADAILLTRGGGSLEDLWVFNLEPVARAVAALRTPVVCAVGHEIDITICDFVADVRAPTPSAGAELLVPDQDEYRLQLQRLQATLKRLWQQQQDTLARQVHYLQQRLGTPERTLQHAAQRIDTASERLRRAQQTKLSTSRQTLNYATQRLHSQSPVSQLQRARVEQHRLAEELHSAMRRNLELQRSRASQSARMLNSLSPLTTVERGYGIVREGDDRVVSDVAQLTAGDTVRTRLRDGWFDATVNDIHSEPLPTAGTD